MSYQVSNTWQVTADMLSADAVHNVASDNAVSDDAVIGLSDPRSLGITPVKDNAKYITLVERHVISEHHPYFTECKHLTYLSKNIYNTALHDTRQAFFDGDARMESFHQLITRYARDNNYHYRQLPAKVARGSVKLVTAAWSAYFELLKLAQRGELEGPVGIPSYKRDGAQVVVYDKQALSTRKRKGYVHLSQTNIYIQTSVTPQFARIVPGGNHYIIEIGYRKNLPKLPTIPDHLRRYASIDIGVNNLAAIASNVAAPLLINGKPLKSINQWYNKQKAKAQAVLTHGRKTSKRISRMSRRCRDKIDHYMHNASAYIVNYLVTHGIDTLVIGHNPGWKQNINLGKRNNQNFVSLPFTKLISQLMYKCRLRGIRAVLQEESYTSKCSFLDNEPVEKHHIYRGRRVHRGLFVSSDGTYINADINGALNILRKYCESQVAWNDSLWSDCVEVCSTPVRYTVPFR